MKRNALKKLVLCTETLRNLTQRDLQQAAGAVSARHTVCASDCETCLETATYACSGCQPCL